MSIVIKTLKNTKKISKDLSKTIKSILLDKPNSRIGFDWKDDFLKVSNNLKKIKKLDWSQSKIFPLSVYKEKQVSPLDKDLVEKFLNNINFNKINYVNITKELDKLLLEHKENDLFLFNTSGGVDLMIFFIDSRGNFVYNDYESKKQFLNKSSNGNTIISSGIKSILKAKKIICFCIDESSKDVVFKLNKKHIDEDDILTYLHLHNDITLYTLHSIINKKEINYEKFSQNVDEIRKKLFDTEDDFIFYDDEIKDEEELNSTQLNLDSQNENKNNLDDELDEAIDEDDSYEEENEEESLDSEQEEEKVEDEVEKIINKNENNLFNFEKEKKLNVTEYLKEKDEEETVQPQEDEVKAEPEQEIEFIDNNDEVIEDIVDKTNDSDEIRAIKKKPEYQVGKDGLPTNREDLIKYIQIKKETLNKIENIILQNKIQELKNKTQEKYMLLKELRQSNIKKYTNPNYVNPVSEPTNNVDTNESNDDEIMTFKPENNAVVTGYKLRYIEGLRPVPMLMVWHDKNKNFYENLLKEMEEEIHISLDSTWTDDFEHVWNDGCYIIYEKESNIVKALAFRSEDRLVFLMRYINKNLVFNFDSKDNYDILNGFFGNKEDEFKVEQIHE